MVFAGGLAGNLKMTMPAAFTTAMLAWGLLSFQSGYSQQPDLPLKVQQQVIWGADYLLKTVKPSSQGFNLVYQVQLSILRSAKSRLFSCWLSKICISLPAGQSNTEACTNCKELPWEGCRLSCTNSLRQIKSLLYC